MKYILTLLLFFCIGGTCLADAEDDALAAQADAGADFKTKYDEHMDAYDTHDANTFLVIDQTIMYLQGLATITYDSSLDTSLSDTGDDVSTALDNHVDDLESLNDAFSTFQDGVDHLENEEWTDAETDFGSGETEVNAVTEGYESEMDGLVIDISGNQSDLDDWLNNALNGSSTNSQGALDDAYNAYLDADSDLSTANTDFSSLKTAKQDVIDNADTALTNMDITQQEYDNVIATLPTQQEMDDVQNLLDDCEAYMAAEADFYTDAQGFDTNSEWDYSILNSNTAEEMSLEVTSLCTVDVANDISDLDDDVTAAQDLLDSYINGMGCMCP